MKNDKYRTSGGAPGVDMPTQSSSEGVGWAKRANTVPCMLEANTILPSESCRSNCNRVILDEQPDQLMLYHGEPTQSIDRSILWILRPCRIMTRLSSVGNFNLKKVLKRAQILWRTYQTTDLLLVWFLESSQRCSINARRLSSREDGTVSVDNSRQGCKKR